MPTTRKALSRKGRKSSAVAVRTTAKPRNVAAKKQSPAVAARATGKRRNAALKKGAPAVGKSLRKYHAKRDFKLTKEPSGKSSVARSRKSLAFVIQKHAASHLHFDLRLEVDGVMKSWAVPKGPSVDASVKRLAMEVEDHPMEYNKFEGTIPQGEYGGGTVMIWDRGTYSPDEIDAGANENDAVRRALAAGKLAFTFDGVRLKGSYALARTRRGEEHPQWLLIKHRDKYAKDGRDIVEDIVTSVESGRRMEEIAAADNTELAELEDAGAIEPMEATKHTLPLPAGEYALESEPEGVRVVAFVTNGTTKLIETSRASKKKSTVDTLENAPRVAAALLQLARNREGALVLDGYLVDDTFVVVDALLDDDALLSDEPWIERRTRLEASLAETFAKSSRSRSAILTSQWVASNAEGIVQAAREMGTGAFVAKRIDSPYESGASKYWIRVTT